MEAQDEELITWLQDSVPREKKGETRPEVDWVLVQKDPP